VSRAVEPARLQARPRTMAMQSTGRRSTARTRYTARRHVCICCSADDRVDRAGGAHLAQPMSVFVDLRHRTHLTPLPIQGNLALQQAASAMVPPPRTLLDSAFPASRASVRGQRLTQRVHAFAQRHRFVRCEHGPRSSHSDRPGSSDRVEPAPPAGPRTHLGTPNFILRAPGLQP